jgi:ethanolamine ammonia-lyase large subunit
LPLRVRFANQRLLCALRGVIYIIGVESSDKTVESQGTMPFLSDEVVEEVVRTQPLNNLSKWLALNGED